MGTDSIDVAKMGKPKRTLSKGDVQLEIADYIRDNVDNIDFIGGQRPCGPFQVVATIQQPLRNYTGIGSFNVELCFTGDLISPYYANTVVEVLADNDLHPYVNSVKSILIRR